MTLVLCYHAVSARWPDRLAVEAATLEAQVSGLLRRGFRAATAAEAVARKRRAVHVTFDDAYRSVVDVLPALERLGVPVTVFACSAYADSGRPLDIPELADEAERFPADLATMDWSALRAVAERGVEVGSHTARHPHLTALADDELAHELCGSKEEIEDALGRRCRFLAYPYGEEDARVRAAAQAAGYEAAFALPGRSRPVDRFAVPRVGIYRRDGAARFALKTSPIYERASAALREFGIRRPATREVGA